jgi:hypothetical protein
MRSILDTTLLDSFPKKPKGLKEEGLRKALSSLAIST